MNQYMKHVRVFNEMQVERFKERDTLNYMLGKYVAYAFNDPKKYPDEPFTHKDTNHNVEMSEDEMEQQALRNTIMMGGVVK